MRRAHVSNDPPTPADGLGDLHRRRARSRPYPPNPRHEPERKGSISASETPHQHPSPQLRALRPIAPQGSDQTQDALDINCAAPALQGWPDRARKPTGSNARLLATCGPIRRTRRSAGRSADRRSSDRRSSVRSRVARCVRTTAWSRTTRPPRSGLGVSRQTQLAPPRDASTPHRPMR